MMRRFAIASVFGAFAVCFGGCAKDMVTVEHFNLIHLGTSTRTDVRATLGEEYEDRGEHWEYERMDRHLTVFFYFDDDGTVTKKDWIDAKAGAWDSSDEDPAGEKVYDSMDSKALEENN